MGKCIRCMNANFFLNSLFDAGELVYFSQVNGASCDIGRFDENNEFEFELRQIFKKLLVQEQLHYAW